MHAVADICSEFENLSCDQGCTLGDDDKASCFCDTGYSLASDNQTCVGEFFGFYSGYPSYKTALGIWSEYLQPVLPIPQIRIVCDVRRNCYILHLFSETVNSIENVESSQAVCY